jgi:stearoyl-CoA desaturase (Delta-9 desaturase)
MASSQGAYAGRQLSDRRRRLGNAIGLILPLAAFLVAIFLLWNSLVAWTDLAVLAVMYPLAGFGTTVGFHRLLTHRSFATYRPVEYLLAGFGSMSFQGSVIDWVADHRKHHAHADHAGDPHSPHLGHSVVRGLWHAHVGWLFESKSRSDRSRYAPELLEDPVMRAIDRAFPAFTLVSLGLPFLLGWALSGSLAGGLTGMLWGGLVRIFLFGHATFSVNSICHYFGRRRFHGEDRSTNVAWLSPFTLGESWHHNHHAFPRSAMHGLRRFELDPSGLVISALERFGLAWNVIRIAPERQRQKLVMEGMGAG